MPKTTTAPATITTIVAWNRVNRAPIGADLTLNLRTLVRAGVMTRTNVWKDETVNVRGTRAMLDFLRGR